MRAMNERHRAAALGPVLILTTMVVSIISALGAPLIPTIARTFHESLSTAQWSLTVGLVSGAISAPVMGRLGDGRHRRRTILGGLGAVTLGGVVAALAPSLVVLVIGRALQGVGLGLVPLTMATARDELPKHRVAPMIAVLSVCTAAGVGAGYPISGLIADQLGLSAAYWFGAIVTGFALLCTAVVIPASIRGRSTGLDSVGAALLAAGLVCLLVAVAQGTDWGWGSPQVLGLLFAGLALFTIWAFQQLRAGAPLVDLRLLRRPAVLAGDVCATVLGVAMYMNLSAVTEFVQMPGSLGGLSASVVVAGLILIPLSTLMLLGSRILPTLLRRLGVRSVLGLGSLVVAAAAAYFALFHDSLWQAFVMMGILGIGLGTTYAAIPGLIIQSVPPRETGSAMGFYQVVRYVGFSLGSALAAAILAGNTTAGQPDVAGYTMVLWVSVGICVIASGLAWILPARAEWALASAPAPAAAPASAPTWRR